MLSVAWREQEPEPKKPEPIKGLIVGPQNTVTIDEMWAMRERQSTRI
jgi:hypothetical protein